MEQTQASRRSLNRACVCPDVEMLQCTTRSWRTNSGGEPGFASRASRVGNQCFAPKLKRFSSDQTICLSSVARGDGSGWLSACAVEWINRVCFCKTGKGFYPRWAIQYGRQGDGGIVATSNDASQETKKLFAHLHNKGELIERDDVYIKFLERNGKLTAGFG